MYEEESEGDSEEVRGQRFEKIMMSMQKVSVGWPKGYVEECTSS